MIHGFSSAPIDLQALGQFLAKKNITVSAPLLKGHGTSIEDFDTTGWKDWYNDAEKALLKLKKHCNKVYITGISNSGNLCILLAARHKVNGIILMGAPMFFTKEFLVKLGYYLYPIIVLFKRYQKKWYQKGIDPELKKNRMTYPKLSLKASKEALVALNKAEKLLPKITAPILIMQSNNDVQVREDSPQYIFNHVSSKSREIFWVPESYHVFIVDKNKQIAFDKIYKFIQSHS